MVTKKEKKFKILFRKALYLSPNWLQHLIRVFYLRFGFPQKISPIKNIKFYRFLTESQWWPRHKLEDYQAEKLKQLLRYAYDNVKYYHEVFRRLDLTPQDFNSIKDLQKLPILTKEDVVKNFGKLISTRIKRRYLELKYTSGSTGQLMQFYYDKRNYAIDYAFIRRYADWMDIKISDKCVKLWSRPFIEKGIEDIYLYEPFLKRLSLSTTPYSSSIFGQYVKLIKQFNPVYITGNPSMLYNLACYTQENNIDNIKFKCFFSIFENLFTYQRELIEKQFSCEIFNCYSCEERVISAFECAAHQGIHIEMERGILEITGEDGRVLPEGKAGRITATGLYNYAMPLIRYDTGDIGSVSEKPCSCKRALPLLGSLDGRANEVIKYKGKYIYSTTLSVILWKFKNIKECQFVQEKESELILNIVKRSDFSENDAKELLTTLRRMINEELNVTINFIDHIPRNKMGKFPFVVSKLNEKVK